MSGRRTLLVALAGSSLVLHAAAAQLSPPATALPNSNEVSAGSLRDGVLAVTLELRLARWYPDADDGTALLVPVFAESGRAPQVPAPLLRMPAGTELKVTLHNRLDVKATVYGLHARPSDRPVPIELEPGATRELRFTAGAPGTYHYYAIADPEVKQLGERWYHDGALSGAFIIDEPGATPHADRVWVLNIVTIRGTPILEEHEILTINGKAWPHTERLSARQGEPVRWRVVNSTPSEHPMHLHGAYFNVLGTGTAERYDRYAQDERRTVVTEYMLPGSTFDLVWTPLAAGGWLFHCHYVLHVAPHLEVPTVLKRPAHGTRAAEHSPPQHEMHGMGGLVLAIDVQPRAAAAPAKPARSRTRQLELVLQPHPDAKHAIVSTIRDPGTRMQASSSPAPLLLLRRDEPVEITVINRLNEPTAIHWHGIELESYYDGVPGIGGRSGQVTPVIAPGGSFSARLTPPRAGTFIYHTHWAHEAQLSGGLYGPLIVIEPGERFDSGRQKVMLVGAGELRWTTREILLNGERNPPPLELKRGQTYRLRLINIAPNVDITATLGTQDKELEWRIVAKDGFELPPSQRRVSPARLVFSVGETYDFEFTPTKAGTYQLRFKSNFTNDPAGQAVAEVRVR